MGDDRGLAAETEVVSRRVGRIHVVAFLHDRFGGLPASLAAGRRRCNRLCASR